MKEGKNLNGLKYLCFIREIKSNSLAKELGVSPGNFADWLSTRRPIPDKYLNLLSEKFNVSPEYLVSEVELQEATTKDVSDIYEATELLMQEIIIRRGSYYFDGRGIELSDLEGLICNRYLNNEISHDELLTVIRQFNLNIPIVSDDVKQKDFMLKNDIDYCSYSHVRQNREKYYSILSEEFKFENIFEFYDDDELILQKKMCIEENEIVIAPQYGDEDLHTVVYINEKLVGCYYYRDMFNDYSSNCKFDWKMFNDDISKLFEFENLDKKQCLRMCKAYKKAVINHLATIKKQKEERRKEREREQHHQEQEKKEEQERQYRQYQQYQKTYSSSGFGLSSHLSYSEEQKKVMKKMFKFATQKMHPDAGGSEAEMKVLVGLKEEWGI